MPTPCNYLYRSGIKMKCINFILALVLIGISNLTVAADKGESFQSLDEQVQSLKQEVLNLNRDLFLLEEELLFPASTQVAVFLSIDIGKFFQLDAVQLKLGKKVVANHLYTEREIEALTRGGVQRLYIGNFKVGKHELVAIVIGKGPKGRDFKLGTTIAFEKQEDPLYMELKLVDIPERGQPKFDVKIWE